MRAGARWRWSASRPSTTSRWLCGAAARGKAGPTGRRECQARLAAETQMPAPRATREALLTLAADLEAAWQASTTDMRTKQRRVRALIEEIVVDVDDATREVVLVVHWRGGQHSEVPVRKPEPGEHTKRTSTDTG